MTYNKLLKGRLCNTQRVGQQRASGIAALQRCRRSEKDRK